MAATLSAGVSSLILKLDTPYDRVRLTDIRDDLVKVQVWCSTTSGFTPSNSNKVFDGLSLSVVISKITTDGTTFSSLVAGTTYYVKYAFISAIDDVSATAYTVSTELTATPIVASAQTVDISGYTGFSKTGTTFAPATATLTAVINGITSPVYAWTITGGTLSATNTASVIVTPSTSATSISVTLSVTGSGLSTPITKTIVMAITVIVQSIDISGYTSFVQNAALVFTPANTQVSAILQNITGGSIAWTVTGGTFTGSGATITITPNAGSTGITVVLNVSGGNLAAPLSKTVNMPVVYNGAKGEVGAAGTMSAFISIYKWTDSSTPPARPTTTSTYTWGSGAFTEPATWYKTIQTNSTPGHYLWSITIPLIAAGTVLESTLDWTSTANPIRSISYNGSNGSNGSATYLIERGASTNNAAPTNAEVMALIGRNPVAGDIATVSYNNYNGALIYKYAASWSLMTTYIPGSLIVQGTITGDRLVTGTVTADLIDSRGLSIKDSSGNVILSAGVPLTASNITASSSWVNSNISIGSNGALNGGGGGQVSITGLGYTGDLNATNGAPTGTYVAGTLAQTVVSNASSAKIAADQATIDVATKLNKNTADTLSAVVSVSTTTVAGLRVGNLVWNSAGVRQSGFGVAITPGGLVGFNSAGTNTFSISASNGDAYFAGTLNVSGTTSGDGSMTVTNNNIIIRDASNNIRVKLGLL
jgi:hypothetical protein